MSEASTINSRDYWEQRFRENWRERGGAEQTRFFAQLLAQHLPGWLAGEIRRHQMTLCDWGCAEGEAVFCLGQLFSGQRLTGVDYAAAAIEKARAKFPGYEFTAADWVADPEHIPSFDVVVSSNVLEHFHDPLRILRDVLGRAARKFIVLLLPFAEDPDRMDREHFFRFLKENLPLAWGRWTCAGFEVISTASLPETHWFGEQALVIYADQDWLRESNLPLTLAGLPADTAILGERLRSEYEADSLRQAAEAQGLRENLAMARQAVSEQKIAYEDKLRELSERLRDALAKCEAATRAEAATREALARLEPLAAEAQGLRENLAMARQAVSEQTMRFDDMVRARDEAAARAETVRCELDGLRENLAMTRQALADMMRARDEAAARAEAVRCELDGARENLAMARQALAEQQIAYENKLRDFSTHYQQMSRDRDEALAGHAVARHELVEAYGRLVGLNEEISRQRQRLATLGRQEP